MPKHLLDAQQKAKKARVKDEIIRANIGFSPLKPRIKSTSSPITPNSSTYVISPALQKSTSSTKPKSTTSNTESRYPLFFKEKLTFSQLHFELQNKIYKKAYIQDEYLLRKWIDYKKLDLKELAKNPNCTSYFYKKFKANPDDKQIDWYFLSGNPNAIELIKEKLLYEKSQDRDVLTINEKVNWEKLSANPNAIELLEQKIKEEKELRDTNPANFRELNYSEKIN